VTDLGWTDSSAFSLCLWREEDPNLYIARSYKRQHLTLTDVEKEVKALQALVPQSKLVIDDAIEAGRRGDARALEPAVHARRQGEQARLHPPPEHGSGRVEGEGRSPRSAQPLVEEWSTLLWDERASTRKELATCENHCADTVLYGWRYARNFMVEIVAPEKPKTGRPGQVAGLLAPEAGHDRRRGLGIRRSDAQPRGRAAP
jgi:hypothetical protein